MKKVFISLVVMSLCLFSSASSFALTKGFEASSFRPSTDNGRYYNVWDSKNLGSYEWRLGTVFTYEYRSLQLTNAGTRVSGIVDHASIQHIYASLGLIDQWLSVGLDLPIGWYVRYTNPRAVGSTATTDLTVGDLRLNFKSTLYTSPQETVGIALVPFIDLPTGFGREFFGNGTVNVGFMAVLEATPWKKFHFSFNAGISGRDKYNFRNIEKYGQLLLGLGVQYEVLDNLSINAEVNSQTRLTGMFKEKAESPAEGLVGVKWNLGRGWAADIGGGIGITNGSGSPKYRGFVGFNYTPKLKK